MLLNSFLFTLTTMDGSFCDWKKWFCEHLFSACSFLLGLDPISRITLNKIVCIVFILVSWGEISSPQKKNIDKRYRHLGLTSFKKFIWYNTFLQIFFEDIFCEEWL